ncbi:MAG: nitroreductase family deazaflavin-dependent oxidoreductase [Anaerolineales bacterium]|nr:nitroreductase family deazaflavin-dependent oxidoreductase [Anaerolineales bacterium]
MKPWVMFWASRRTPLSRVLLVLETTGRKSGLPRRTPLQYEQIAPDYYLGSARGSEADWVRNIRNNPAVRVGIGGVWMTARGELLATTDEIVAFLRIRLERNPFMVKQMLRLHGVSGQPGSDDLARVARAITVVRLVIGES